MNICLLSHSAEKGGAGRSLMETVEALATRGARCLVVMPEAGELNAELEKRGIDFQIVPFKPWLAGWLPVRGRLARVIPNAKAILRLLWLFSIRKIDVVYTNTAVLYVGAIAARLAGLPHVWHVREFGYEDHGLSFDIGEKRAIRLIGRLSSVVVANSQAVAKKYGQAIPSSKIKVIYQGIRDESENALLNLPAPQRFRCLIAGSIHEGKGQIDAIEAVAQLVKSNVDVELQICGRISSSGYFNFLKERVKVHQLDSRVSFETQADQAWPYYRAANVVLVCSRCEAFGRVTVEAMLAGKPVIGTRSGGTPELIREGFNGMLYEPGHAEELADKIRALYANKKEGERLCENGRQWALKQFDPGVYGDAVFQVVMQVGGQPAGA